MEYQGKLYGKIGDTYFDTGRTSDEFDQMERKVKAMEEKTNSMPVRKAILSQQKSRVVLKFKVSQLIVENPGCNKEERYSHPAFTRKMPKDFTPTDFDKKGKKIEIETESGKRFWLDISDFFGTVICESSIIMVPDNDTNICFLEIVSIEVFKVKRTMYWKLIFEKDYFPF